MVGCLLINKHEWQQNSNDLKFFTAFEQSITFSSIQGYPDWICLKLEVEDKIPVWQLALELEWTNTTTSYGFGETLAEAKKAAIETLTKRLQYN
ncbi:hypothetical protein [Amphibacillus sediminis]|uniref:hypothetical protein n=1 Tax=Amphibacillus sediminis TaxID=360185 RepID=UPI00082B13BB|nr:hypothetical protein [Amphibacillus sediminis]